ncbi:MAG: triple tyrosine motif-containing protein [Salinivirgaceae bacterium]|jgi:ligand-binding sensor domain-containing protein/DNA-binding CsgD family transcriptional regulator|nr:triple tyrosine motif-containing protein [Salinivirgaceae bacterium]
MGFIKSRMYVLFMKWSRASAYFVFLGLILLSIQLKSQFQNVYFDEIPELAYILSIHQDSEGYMWFGTYNGLIKYDGIDYTIYRYKKDSLGISNPVVHSIAEDENGNIWIGTEHGLNKFNKETLSFTQYKQKQNDSLSFSSTHIRDLEIDKNGIVWVGTRGGGLNRFDPQSGIISKIMFNESQDGLSGNLINSLSSQGDSLLYIGLEYNGLNVYNKRSGKITRYFTQPNTTIAATYVDGQNTLWVGTWNKGLYKKPISDSIFQKVQLIDKIDWSAKSITEDKDGNLWIGTFGDGLVKLHRNREDVEYFTSDEGTDNSLGNNLIWSMLLDNSNLLWIGSFGNGISKYDKYANKFTFVKTSAKNNGGLKMGSVRCITQYENAIYFACNNGLYTYSQSIKSYQPLLFDGIERGYSCIFNDSKNNLWLGFNGGLVQFDKQTGKYRYYFKPEYIPHFEKQDVNLVKEDKEGNIWFAVYDGGLFKIASSDIDINAKGIPIYESFILGSGNKVIPSNIIWDIAFTFNNEVWICANSSLCFLNKKTGVFERIGHGAHSVMSTSYLGQLWVGSLGLGLGKLSLNNKSIEYFSEDQGLSSNLVNGVVVDKGGNIWLSSPKGISMFNPLNNKFKNYDVSDGIDGKRFNINSNTLLESGEIYFGGSKGFVKFHPNYVFDNPHTPNVVFRDVKIFNKSITYEKADSLSKRLNKPLSFIKSIEIGPKDKMLSIEFVALTYSAPEHIQYAYRLNGFNHEWTYSKTGNPSATYTNLEGGSYTFEVKAANADGVWSEKVSSLQIEVLPPLWKRLWFRILLFSVVLLFVWFYIRKVYTDLKQKHLLEKTEQEKEIAKLRNDKLNAELEYKNNELISKTTILLHKNEKIKELKNNLNDILLKVSVTSRPKLFSLVKFVEKELENDQFWDQFEHQFNLTHNNFLERFKAAHAEINHKDLKLCAYIRMNLSNHEIGTLLNITYKGVEARRQRLRKKLDLERSDSLNDFIMSF